MYAKAKKQSHSTNSMKRSSLVPTSAKSFSLLGRKSIKSKMRPRQEYTNQANASWGHDYSSTQPTNKRLDEMFPTQERNIFLQKDDGINELLNLLHTDEFRGEIDPKYHSRFLQDPEIHFPATTRRPRLLGERRSDSQLLRMRRRRSPRAAVSAD